MKNGRLFGMGLITSLVAILVFGYFFFTKNTEVQATGISFKGETYSITLKQPIMKESLTDGSIVVLDENEKVTKAKFSINSSGKILSVDGLNLGKYTLQIKKDAFAKKTKLQQEQSVTLVVVKKVKNIVSTEDLKDYFRAFLAVENSLSNRFNDMVTNDMAKEESAMSMDNSAKSSGGPSHSTTNNQVEGIDEGDITVTDGRYIYTIIDNKVAIVDTKDLKVVKRITVGKDIYPNHLMIHDKTLIVGYSSYVQTQKEPYDGKSVSTVVFYDVTDAKKATLVREVGHDGGILNIRKSGNYLYVVSSLTPNYWMLQDTPNVELRPSTYDGKKETIMPIDKIRLLPESNEPNYLIVSAIDVSNVKSNEWKTESFLGSSGQMYMSENAIYIASMNHYGFWPEIETADTAVSNIMPAPQNNETTIYKISVDKTALKMEAQGKVTGSILNQFSMDEHDGHFRIATTEGNAWGTAANSKNHLFILDENMKQVGAVKDLAKGERIYSARFMGNKAYLVTFRETDPLFVIDTENPKAPKVLGELKIPGFSNYLHPIDENHLLGIGYDTEVRMEEGSKEPIVLTKGMKLSLFDVTDFNNPKEKQALVIGGRGTYSPVQHDHKALFRDPRQNYYGFPVTLYSPTEEEDRLKYEGTGAHIYKVTASGIELVADMMEKARPGEQYEDYYNVVQRLLYVEDQLFTVSPSKVTSFNGKTFEKQQTVGF
ncbi:beta-propeller domain-containing protein [Solibacillus sp. FSL K6-4121]|uniref:beta-propeller domain-containing protein n=1 Tax=Solibacillus sp. FSL K6-4121 TaxID=2921505 RepID=UPI0030F6382F